MDFPEPAACGTGVAEVVRDIDCRLRLNLKAHVESEGRIRA